MRHRLSGYHKGIYEDAASKSAPTTAPSLAQSQGDPFDQCYTFLLQPIKCLKLTSTILCLNDFHVYFFQVIYILRESF